MINLLKQHSFFKDKKLESYTRLEYQGYCNENYLVADQSQKYIVRKLLRNDIDRDFEWDVLGLAYEQSITAEPLVYDKSHGFMVFAFLEGEHRSTLAIADAKLLADTLKKLHSIRLLDREPIEIKIEHKTDEVLQALQVIEQYPKEYVFCHNDLNPKISFSKEAKLIDFEYAGVNDKYFDLACVCVEFKLDNNMQNIFLDAYFESNYALEKLEAYKVIYKSLVKEWFENML